MFKRSLLGRVFTLCLVYIPNIKQDTFFGGFIFVLFFSEHLTTEGDLNLILNFPVGISGNRSQEFYLSRPFLTQNFIQVGVLCCQVLPSLEIYLFYSHNHLFITPIYYISLSGSLQDSLTQTKRGQMTWSISLSALTTQRGSLIRLKHRKCELNNSLFNSFLALVIETSKNQICFHNATLPSSSLYGIYKVVLRRKLIEKTSGTERGNAEHRFLISVINNLEVYKNIGAKKMLNRLLFLWCLLHAVVSEKIVCILYQHRQKYRKTEKKRHAVTAYKVRRENCIVIDTRKQNRKIHYLLRTHVREVQVKAQHLKGESDGTKSSRGPDPEIKLYKALKDHFLPKLTDLTCYFLDFKPLADTLKEADNIVLKAKKEQSDFSSHRDTPLLNTEFRSFVAVLTATLESVLPKVLCTASVKISQRQLLLDNFHVLLIMRHSDLIMLKFGILFPLKKEMACGHLKWKFSKEILMEDVRNEWTEVVLFLEPSQLSRQTWNSYSLLALFGKQCVRNVRMNKPKSCLNANELIYKTMLSLKEILLVSQTASNPLHLRTFQLLKLIISVHKLCEYDVQVKVRSGYKFILRWSNATESTG
ncbi:pro-neuregulin-4, membrane-bound isoform isoform X1 [Athene cunicularia]|uniref:pro-neuregulin-4, membrane-bound isoform isoform X1 n=1 Tax=Athene cunicularia TaxID=194338 RepID=UPI000EF69BB3|nr:pro-neuregulin-4, membrane-bound isoform isoform X1 [Athene cunicularia]XP_026711724.1 pro-neuregulin-4, membrane-bound isoform isoform X1 [Athene cunicularia]XP_026711725.1 pro-neuregulin-4, membrane-bound isoform isoform X1 [Athene cunicularia]